MVAWHRSLLVCICGNIGKKCEKNPKYPGTSGKKVKNPEISEENVKNHEISEAKERIVGERMRFSNLEISEENKTNPDISAKKVGDPEISEIKTANPS